MRWRRGKPASFRQTDEDGESILLRRTQVPENAMLELINLCGAGNWAKEERFDRG